MCDIFCGRYLFPPLFSSRLNRIRLIVMVVYIRTPIFRIERTHARWIIRLAVAWRICIQLQLRNVSERDKEMARPSGEMRSTERNGQEEESARIRYTRA